MPITPKQREARVQSIGSSDIAALLGASPFATPLDVYNSKVNPGPEKKSDAKQLGNYLEPAIALYVADRLKAKMKTDCLYRHDNGVMAANCDAILFSHYFRRQIDEPCVLEVKTTGFKGVAPESNQYGKGGTEEIPPRIMLQAQHQLACTGLDLNIVALLSGHDGRGCRMYRIKRNPALIRVIEDVSTYFWNHYVIPKQPPSDEDESILPLLLRHRAAQDHSTDSLSRWLAG